MIDDDRRLDLPGLQVDEVALHVQLRLVGVAGQCDLDLVRRRVGHPKVRRLEDWILLREEPSDLCLPGVGLAAEVERRAPRPERHHQIDVVSRAGLVELALDLVDLVKGGLPLHLGLGSRTHA